MMKKRVFHICIGACLCLFFLGALIMTHVSHQNYLANCVVVELLDGTTSESLTITQNIYAACTLNADSTFTFHWNNDEVFEKMVIGEVFFVDVGDRIVPAEIVNRYEMEGEQIYMVRLNALIGDILAAGPIGFGVSASYIGERRAYVVPASCVKGSEGIYEIALAVETPKAWGMAYSVHYEPIQIHEINSENVR